jgi:hypothetical protein
MSTLRMSFGAIALVALSCLASARAADKPAAPAASALFDVAADGAEKAFTPSWGAEEQVSVARSTDKSAPGLVVTIKPGKAGYPGVNLKPGWNQNPKPEGAVWDLSAFGHVEARVVNTGEKKLLVALRVDNAGDWQKAPWNTEQVWLNPGEAGTIKVIFGYHYNHQPGFALKPAEVVNIAMFTNKADADQSFRLESLDAGGTAGEKPE